MSAFSTPKYTTQFGWRHLGKTVISVSPLCATCWALFVATRYVRYWLEAVVVDWSLLLPMLFDGTASLWCEGRQLAVINYGRRTSLITITTTIINSKSWKMHTWVINWFWLTICERRSVYNHGGNPVLDSSLIQRQTHLLNLQCLVVTLYSSHSSSLPAFFSTF